MSPLPWYSAWPQVPKPRTQVNLDWSHGHFLLCLHEVFCHSSTRLTDTASVSFMSLTESRWKFWCHWAMGWSCGLGVALIILVRGSSVASGDTVHFREILYPSPRVPSPRWIQYEQESTWLLVTKTEVNGMLQPSQSPLAACRPAAGFHPPVCVGILVNVSEQHFMRHGELKHVHRFREEKIFPWCYKNGGGLLLT